MIRKAGAPCGDDPRQVCVVVTRVERVEQVADDRAAFQQPVGEFGVGVNTATDNGHHHRRRPPMDFPSAGRVDVGPERTGLSLHRLSGVAETPLPFKIRIVRNAGKDLRARKQASAGSQYPT